MKKDTFFTSQRAGKVDAPVILHITHSCGGGTEKHIRELREHFRDRAEMLVLRPGEDRCVLVERRDRDGRSDWVFDPVTGYRDLVTTLKNAYVSRIHIHQLFSLPLEVRKLIIDLGVPFDTTVHDYYGLCPQVHFKTKANQYCGEPDETHCFECLGSGPDHERYQHHWIGSHDYVSSQPGEGAPDIEWWRQSHGWVFVDAQRVLCPSADVALRITRYHPSSNCIVVPHDSLSSSVHPPVNPCSVPSDEPLVVGILGGMNPFKGAAKVSAAAIEARCRKAPLLFHVIGPAERRMPLAPAAPLLATGSYHEYEVHRLIKAVKPHLIWFPTQVPETFSYTLSEAMEAGLPVVVPDIGSFAGRIRGRPWSWVVSWNMSATEMVSFFCRIRRENFQTGTPPHVGEANGQDLTEVSNFYECEYLSAIDL